MCKKSLTRIILRNVVSEKKVRSIIKVDEYCYNVESNFKGKTPLVDMLYKIASYRINGINQTII